MSVPGTHTVYSPVPTVNPLARIVWEQTGLPASAASRRVRLLHGTVNVIPMAFPGATVATVHDLSFLRLPDQFPRMKANYLRYAVDLSARRATHLIAVSEHTRRDVIELLHVPEERISVVYSGASPDFRPLPHSACVEFRRRHFDGRPLILHVGTLQPRKNVDVLIRSFAHLRRTRDIPHVLALVGARGWMYRELFDLVVREGVSEHVRFVDFVPSGDLPLWYNSADLFAYPSAYEGFGLPVLEAMACGVPVITSAASALAELAGEAAVTVSPGSQEALQLALIRVLDDEQLRADLSRRGLVRAAEFTWSRTARDTAAIYDRVLAGAAS